LENSLQLIRQNLKEGDNSEIARIFTEHGDYCIRTLIRNTNCSKQDAEDILMESVLNFRDKVVSGKVTYLTSIRQYIYSTCYNMWLKEYQKRKRREIVGVDLIKFYVEEYSETMDTSEYFDNKKAMIRITKKAMATLKTKCRRVLSLFYVERYSMKEVAKMMNFANDNVAKTIKSRCFNTLIAEVKRIQEKEKIRL
jgi:RNA polymerase sigma factor (sigma-70 family)